jgi:hypothetical protein
MVPVGIPLATRVLVMAAVTIAITNPSSLMTIDVLLRVFRLLPAPVAVLIALDANAVIAVEITALKRPSDCHTGEHRRESQRGGDND